MNELSALRIEATHKTIGDIFCEAYAFSIPPYQRPYAWERTQVEELLNDLIEAMRPQKQADGFYFLGSVVLVKSHGSPEAKVVDGQQRLTTLTILFSVLRDLTDDIQARLKRERYVKQAADEDMGLREKLRLQMRRQDQPFFERHVQTTGATAALPASAGLDGSEARIIENAGVIRARLEPMSEQQRSDFIRFLLLSCYLVVVEVPTDAAARRIFTVLNARGMDLSATDILKANLLERAGHAERTLGERWEECESALNRDGFIELFTHIRMIFERDKPRNSLENGFEENVPPFKGDPTAFMDQVLEPYADAFALSLDDGRLRKQFGPKTAALIQSLHRLDNKDWLPPLLFCLRRAADGAAVDVSSVVFSLERLAYFLFVTRADVNTRIARYADVLDTLDPATASRDRSAGLAVTGTEAFSMFSAMNGPVYLASRVVKPLLLRLEQASTDGSATYDYPTITVEHVCPQNPADKSDWKTSFPDPEVHADLVHRIGNLVLLAHRKNAAASNYDFNRKKETYFAHGDSSAFTLTAEVRGKTRWDEQQIRERQIQMLGRLASAWHLTDVFARWHEQQIMKVMA
ncbi:MULTISPECIES: DUF262 domain-containing protein [unclassified Mesorhizobium]|uniref:DUF262 domain-containing protein n=1 Tax=unclassified Mesorhizobium TaxID=325217 RepID=UPI0003CE2AF9|nr:MULTISPECIES: DUF262 domain-containing protein [unclassified Mesorhizobium]ESY55395.1 hypothetical protein X745_11925 [Mesorhizobium sp. LNJC374B00]WJI79386.1 DUF262 domain-containing HNH endonuclease family protein [Mesorhizobium sp. C374B]WJI85922.1 DUF262 domain-containing HNH endonuclease family protein [Mesorhizobium sp. C372A]